LMELFAVLTMTCLPQLSVKQLGSGGDTDLLSVSSRSKLFAYSTLVVLGGLRVKL